MKYIAMKEIQFGYGEKHVLDGFSLRCEEGEFLGILGPNGSGKTTVLRLMAGYLQPQGGSVEYSGQDIRSIRARDLACMRAVVEQRLTSPFEYSVYDYVMLGRTPYLGRFRSETGADHAMVERSLLLCHAEHLGERNISELSGGELQRVMIARALAQEPDFLILDEPTAHLDVRHQLEIMQLLQHLADGIAVIAVIHDINLATTFCDRLVLLSGGKVAVEGTPETMLGLHSLREVFSVDALRLHGPADLGQQLAFSLPGKAAASGKRRIHLISGGGCGQRAAATLVAAGYEVSLGVLNQGDNDLEAAAFLGCAVLTAPPFSPIGRDMEKELREVCSRVDGIVLVAMPVGLGNIPNLRVACEFLKEKPVFLLAQGPDITSLDHTGGEAAELFARISESAAVVQTTDALLAALENSLNG